jgi:peroxiredoxin
MNLEQTLDARKAEFLRTAPAERVAAYQRGVDELAANGIAQRAVQAGETAPAFTLPDALGRPVRLADRLARGPVVLTFYRGGWCPYCNLQLRAYQQMLPDLARAGATLLAVSPETPDDTLSTAQKNELAFDVLSDAGGRVADAYRLNFELSEELHALYAAGGIDLPRRNGDGRWQLPIPATFVIGTDGKVARAWVDVEYRNRAEPAEIAAAVALLAR